MGDELGVSGRGPSGISGACEMTNGGGFWAGVTAAADLTVLVAGLTVVVVVVVSLLLLPPPKNFLKPPNQPDFLVVTSTSGSGVISISLV